MKCRSCNSTNLELILNLGNHPWCNDFLTKDELNTEKIYPLRLVYCNECTLLQLDYTVPKETMFKKHTYVSSTTNTLKKHFYDLAVENRKQFNLNKTDLIIDIGGNDGTQMQEYVNAGCTNVLNIESADNIAKISVNVGIPTINAFFNEDLVHEKGLTNSAKLINASGVFFHLEELHSVIRGINSALSDDGVFVVQFMYAGTMVEMLNFDGIYHEHLCYYTINSLTKLLEPYKLRLFDAYYSDIHSGSIIAKVCKQTASHKATKRYSDALQKDSLYDLASFKKFSAIVQSKKGDLKKYLQVIKQNNPKAKIYAYGAPAKGNTLLNYFDIDNTLIDKCVEVNDLKVGLYTPKTHIPIVKESVSDIPDYYLLLAHNFASEILNKNKDLINKGVKFIIPFPEITVIG